MRFNPNGISPKNGTISSRNCSVFYADEAIPERRYSTFRVSVPEEDVEYVNVTLLGENMTCDHDLYAMPLSVAQTDTWAGMWLTCPLLETSVDGDLVVSVMEFVRRSR